MRTGERSLQARQATGQLRIVGERGAAADHDRVVAWRADGGRAARASSPVIQRLAPVRVAIRPSSEVASLRVTSGRPARTRRKNPAFSALGLVLRQPDRDLDAGLAQLLDAAAVDPRVRDRAAATTARRMPAWSSAMVQGGVRP